MGEELRPALLLGDSMPARGTKNTIWSMFAGLCLLLSAGGVVNALLKLADTDFLRAVETLGFAWSTGFSAMFCAAQTTWGSPRVQRLYARPRATGHQRER